MIEGLDIFRGIERELLEIMRSKGYKKKLVISVEN